MTKPTYYRAPPKLGVVITAFVGAGIFAFLALASIVQGETKAPLRHLTTSWLRFQDDPWVFVVIVAVHFILAILFLRSGLSGLKRRREGLA